MSCRIIKEETSTRNNAHLNSLGYTKAKLWVQGPNCNGKCYECAESDSGNVLCKEVTCPDISGCTDPSADNYNASATINDGSCTYTTTATTTPTPSTTTTPSSGGIREIFKNVTSTPDRHPDTIISPQIKEDYEFLRFNSDSPAKKARVEGQLRVKYNLPGRKGLITIAINVPIQDSGIAGGSSVASRAFLMPVFKNSGGEWGYANPIQYAEHDIPRYLEMFDESAHQRYWQEFGTILNIYENFKSLERLILSDIKNVKGNIMEEENNSLSQMIDDKLREFNFYSANDKGKQKVVFTDEDREEISKEFDDLIKKYPEDIAFIRAVVLAKGVDKKTEDPVVRLGSYYNNADIELPFNSEMNGLGKLLDGGVIYFTIINNEGPDLRDFKIVGGDKIPEIEFQEKDKEEIELDNYTHSHDQEMAEMDEPFEEVMKKKEQKGLASLLEKGDLTNDLTKRQKEVLENLKKKGFKFEKPENVDIYERVRVSSKEFNESIKAWKPRK